MIPRVAVFVFLLSLMAPSDLLAEVCSQDNIDKAASVSYRLIQKENTLDNLLNSYLSDSKKEFFAHEQSSKELTKRGVITWESKLSRSLDQHTEYMLNRQQRVLALQRKLDFLDENLPDAQKLWRLLTKHCQQEGYADAVNSHTIMNRLGNKAAQDTRTYDHLREIYSQEVTLLQQAQQARRALQEKNGADSQNKQATVQTNATPDDAPCKCIFDKNRKFNPEKIVWKGGVWKCSIYLDNGACNKVIRVRDAP
jgi:lipase chaperone LimK